MSGSRSAEYRLVLEPTGDPGPDVIDCELAVLGHWYGDTEELLETAYGAYRPQTVFLAVRATAGGVVGMCRLIVPGALPLKTISDIAGPPWNVDAARSLAAAGIDPARTWDLATLAVRRELGAGGRTVAAALYHGLIHATRANGAEWVIAIADRRVRSLLSMLGLEQHALPGTAAAPYMGSPACAPAFTHVPSMVARQRTSNPDAYRLITQGHGLVDVELPSAAQFRLPATPPPAAESTPAESTTPASDPAAAVDVTDAVVDLRDVATGRPRPTG